MESHSLSGLRTPAVKTSLPNTDSKKKRKRKSKLAQHFHFIAECLHSNSRAQAKGVRKKSLEAICEELFEQHKTSASKSTLSRFINKHPLLKML